MPVPTLQQEEENFPPTPPPSSPANQRLQQLSQWEASMLCPPPQLLQWTLPLSPPLPTLPFPYKSKSPFLLLWVCLWSVLVCIFRITVPPLLLSKLTFVGEITGCHSITVDRGLSLALSCTGSDCLDAVTLVDVIRFQELGFIQDRKLLILPWFCYCRAWGLVEVRVESRVAPIATVAFLCRVRFFFQC